MSRTARSAPVIAIAIGLAATLGAGVALAASALATKPAQPLTLCISRAGDVTTPDSSGCTTVKQALVATEAEAAQIRAVMPWTLVASSSTAGEADVLGSGLLPISAAYYRLRDNGVWGSNIELADIVGSDGSLGGGVNVPACGQDVQFLARRLDGSMAKSNILVAVPC